MGEAKSLGVACH